MTRLNVSLLRRAIGTLWDACDGVSGIAHSAAHSAFVFGVGVLLLALAFKLVGLLGGGLAVIVNRLDVAALRRGW